TDGPVELLIATNPHAALADTNNVEHFPRRHCLLGDSLGEVAQNLLVGLLEDVLAEQFPKTCRLNPRRIVQVGGRPPRQVRECLLAASVVAEARKVQLDVLESAGAVGPKAIDGLAEYPENEVVNARRGRLVAIDRRDASPVEMVPTVVDERVVLGAPARGVLDEQRPGDLKKTVLLLTEDNGRHLG